MRIGQGNPSAVTLSAVLLTLIATAGSASDRWKIEQDDSIVILGNTFAERLHLFGHFETFLHARFPDHRLKVRNMGWSADEVDRMIRPLGFPKLTDELESHGADAIFLCFGMNESFQGEAARGRFGDALTDFVRNLQGRQFNGESAPHIVLVSPIAHEDVGDDLPGGKQRNRLLSMYSKTIAEVANQTGAVFVDLFQPTAARMKNPRQRKLTFNGIHLTEYGDWVVSRLLAQSLGLIQESAQESNVDRPRLDAFRRAVYVKNYHFFQWWRPPNASYIHGRRNETPGAKHLESERQLRERLIASCEEDVWTMAKPRPGEIWQAPPSEGRPIWYPTPPDREISEGAAQLAVAADGDPAPAMHSADEQLRLMKAPEGYQVNLFAADDRFPIANPMAIQFDAQGRLWVANTPTWPHALPGKQPQDSLVILSDADRDGVADEHRVFIDRLNLLHGFALAGDGAYIAQTPNLLLARDTTGDDRADWFRIVLHGFGAEDAEHSMNNFRWSPGGALFFTQGIFFHTQVETPTGPVRARDAAVFRYFPRQHQFDVYASHSFWNPYGNLFDQWGRGIVLDASAGQSYPMDVISANFVYPKEKERTDHLSFIPAGAIAAGCEWLYSAHFPPEVQGRFLVNHCERGIGTHWYTVQSQGSLYAANRHEPSLLTSEDPTFRPVAMAIGPDGALYVADFYTHIFENVMFSKRHPGRDHSHGRIWRISHKHRPFLSPPDIVGAPVPALLNLLTRYEATTRELARRELQQRGRDAVLPELKHWMAKLDPSAPQYEQLLTEALWVHQGLNVVNAELLQKLLVAEHPGARVAATSVLRFWQRQIDGAPELLRARVNDSDPRVRLQAVLACGFSTSDEALAIALEVVNHEMDPGLDHALNDTLNYFESVQPQQDVYASPAAMAFRIRRLSNEELVAVERNSAEKKFVPVYEALLARPGLRPQYRQEAIDSLAALQRTEPLHQVIAGIERIDAEEQDDKTVLHELAVMLTQAPATELLAHRGDLVRMATSGKRALTRRIAFAAWVLADEQIDAAYEAAQRQAQGLADLLDATSMIPDTTLREPLFDVSETLISSNNTSAESQAAIRAIGYIPARDRQAFEILANLIESDQPPATAILSIRRLKMVDWPADRLDSLLDGLLRFARGVPVAERSSRAFLEAKELAGELAAQLPAERTAAIRNELQRMSVATFLIKTIPNQMLYDRTRIAVEAGALTSVVFENDDTMMHNLVITEPGGLSEVGKAAEAMAAEPGGFERGYIPDSDKIRWSTQLLQPGEAATLSFEAPQQPGVYPFVCTYPGHWRRMFGALIVVADLKAYEADPAAYLANNSVSVQDELLSDDRPRTAWTFDELEPSLEALAHGRSYVKAQRVFRFANCVACHRVNGAGQEVGPDLTKLDPEWSPRDVLRELLEPSKRINEKYQTWSFLLDSGRTVNGLVVEETSTHVKVMEDPLAGREPALLRKDDVDGREKSSTSMMPKGLLDRLTADEILDLIAFVLARGDEQSDLFQGGHHHH